MGGCFFSCMTCEFSGDFLVNKKNAWLISGRILTFNQNRWDLSPSNPDFYIAEARCCFWIEAAKQFLRGVSDIFNPLIQTALVVRKSCPNTDSRVRLATFTLLGQGSVVRLTCLHLAWPPRFRLLFARSGDERGKVMPGGSTHAAHDALRMPAHLRPGSLAIILWPTPRFENRRYNLYQLIVKGSLARQLSS